MDNLCVHPEGDLCEICCEHTYDSDNGNLCVDCGKDGTEELSAKAFDHAKDRMKYGDT